MVAPTHTCTIEDGYVLLRYTAAFRGDDVLAQTDALRAVDEHLILSGFRAAVIDTRSITDLVRGESREFAWSWVLHALHHDVIAVVANGDMVRVQANMTARARQARLRAFGTVEEAARWLRASLAESSLPRPRPRR